MKTQLNPYRSALLACTGAALLGLAACATPVKPDGADALRQQLISLQSDPNLGSRAQVAMKEAEDAVRLAEQPTDEPSVGAQRLYEAERKLGIARAMAEKDYAESQVKTLTEQRDRDRLASRTAEAEAAMSQAERASAAARAQQQAAELARNQANAAQQQAVMSQQQAEAALKQAEAARAETEAIKAQMDELQAKQTARGYVITLGDVLFATGKAELTAGASERLGKLADFMGKNPKQQLVIEGHTDSVGSVATNEALSQRRAESVRAFLMSRGVDGSRVSATGKGEAFPVADNASSAGRQQNRRVEVIIAN